MIVRVLTARPGRTALAALVATLAAAVLAARLQVDPSVERMHPLADPVTDTFERFRALFPAHDAQVVVIAEGEDLWTVDGLRALGELEAALRQLPEVRHVVGPASVVTPEGRAFPEAPAGDGAVRTSAEAAARHPLLARTVVHPELLAAFVRVELHGRRGPAQVAAERSFETAAQAALRTVERPGLRLSLTGAPAIRAEIARTIEQDMSRLMPLAFAVSLVLVGAAFRSWRMAAAAAAAVLASWTWTFAAMAALRIPVALLTSVAPVVVLIVALSDAAHLLSEADERHRRGMETRAAVAAAVESSAGPCLLTQVTIALGFGAMALTSLRAVAEFGATCAAGALLSWVANVTVLPSALALLGMPAGRSHGRRDAVIGWIAGVTARRPRLLLGASALILAAFAASAAGLETRFRVFDDLRPSSELAGRLERTQELVGGVVPLVVFLEGPDATGPAALRFQEALDRFLRDRPERPVVLSVPLVLGAMGPVKDVGEALAAIERRQPLDQVLARDRSAAAVVAYFPNLESHRMVEVVQEVEAEIERRVPAEFRAAATGNLAMTSHVTHSLTRGFLLSLLAAVGVSFGAFFLVLRSVRLALIGLLPNAAPLVVLLGLMPLVGASLKPSTVLIASMALVIADDDTIQYLARYRRRRRTAPAAEAAQATLREAGPGMLITSLAVGGGFLVLLFSAFEGIATMGLLTGATLLVAGAFDLFVTPVLLSRLD